MKSKKMKKGNMEKGAEKMDKSSKKSKDKMEKGMKASKGSSKSKYWSETIPLKPLKNAHPEGFYFLFNNALTGAFSIAATRSSVQFPMNSILGFRPAIAQ